MTPVGVIAALALGGVVLLFAIRAAVLARIATATASVPPADSGTLVVRAFAKTDVGERDNNEDGHLVLLDLNGDTELSLVAVADGIGGHAKGEEASATAIATLAGAWKTNSPRADQALSDWCRDVMPVCDRAVAAAAAEPGKKGMGTTMVLAARRNRDLVVAHAGDSRCYMLQAGVLQRVTKDHSQVQAMIDAKVIKPEEAKTHPLRHVITSNLGGGMSLVDVQWLKLEPGCVLLLCSDGLTDLLDDETVKSILAAHKGDPEAAANELVARALAAPRAGHKKDNITVVVVSCSLK